MLTSFEEWKTKRIDELQVGDQTPINYRKVALSFGDSTFAANPVYMTQLQPKIESLWRRNIYKVENENPGSTADPGRMRLLQDQFIKDVMVVVTKIIRGNDAGGGRSVNLNRGAMNVRPNQMHQEPTDNLATQGMGQGPQIQ